MTVEAAWFTSGVRLPDSIANDVGGSISFLSDRWRSVSSAVERLLLWNAARYEAGAACLATDNIDVFDPWLGYLQVDKIQTAQKASCLDSRA